ncbi:MAG: hypothetical protein IJT00_08490, partial [Lachnospiraceae bacterium]|nr:hypothetical protein [Lachnospiraceae bacterium]
MTRWQRFRFLPGIPLGKNGTRVTGSEEHRRLSRQAASQGAVLLKNDRSVLPFSQGARIATFGKGI